MLSNYIIEKQLGKGTYGVVYKVKKKDDNKIYVLKQISLIGLTQEQKADVKLEAQVLSKIKSKYVVQYYDSFEEDGKLNIIMEYCDSGDLNDFIEKHKQTKHLLSENIVWKIFIKITLGLADIHKLKILHRDLKSLNIFLKKDEDIRVGDLGVAKILNQTYFAKTFIGTPYYLSPEICEDKKYNDKSDVWALGCILYELCTYQHPFTARSQGGLILKILNDNPKPIHTYYSKDLSDLIKLIFDKNFEKRPSCLDILKMKFVIEKAKSLGIYEDIKSSFPEIENSNENNNNDNKEKNNKNNNLIKIKPVIIKNTKNEPKKRPVSGYGGYGLFGRKAINNKLKFNDIGSDKKKNDNSKVLCIDKSENILKKKGFISKNIKIIKKDKNIGKNNISNNKVRKKAIVSPKKKEKEKIFFKEAELFNQKRVNKIIINDPYQNDKNKNNEKLIMNDNMSIFNTKVLNNLVNKNIECSIFNVDKSNNEVNKNNNNKDINTNNILDNIYNTKELNNILNKKDQSIFNEVKDNNKNINNNNINNINNNNNNNKENMNISMESKKVEINKFNYTKDSSKETFMNKEKEKNIINETKVDEEINSSVSIESDIYKPELKDKYQPIKVEEKNKIEEENKKVDKDITKDITQNTISSLNFTELINDFSKPNETNINMGTKSDFIIESNEEINNNDDKTVNLIIQNIDNNESISDDNNSDDKNYYSNDDKYEKNESGEENDDGDENVKVDINIEQNEKEEETNDELNNLKNRIEVLKKEISKLLGEEKYKYIMEICSMGVKNLNQKDVSNKIENFIKENSNNENKEQLYKISLLFILECELYNMQNSAK